MATAYATLTEAKAYLRVGDTVDDVQITSVVEAASRAVDDWCHRTFGLDAVAGPRTYTAAYDYARGRWVVPVDDFQTLTGLAVTVDTAGDGTFSTVVDVAKVTALELNAAAVGRPWTRLVLPSGVDGSGVGAIRVTARWGWTSVPEPVKLATLLQANRFLKRRESPFGIAGSPEMGNEMRLWSQLDPDVKVLLAPYRVFAWGA